MFAIAELIVAAALLAGGPADDRQCVVVVVGAEGEAEYGAQFARWADRWEQAARQAGAALVRIGGGKGEGANDRDRLRQTLGRVTRPSPEPLWLVLIGHGTFDGRQAKFNLRGPDVSAKELAEWLADCQRPLAVINCASSSGPFINRLSAPGRVIVTAAKSGFEQNYSRFGDYLSAALAQQRGDLDKDQQTSLLEAFLTASAEVAEFYRERARLATEHALLDDNGDGLGTPADWFRGVRAVRTAKEGASPDGARARQFHLIRSERERSMPPAVRARRDELELAVLRLRETKDQFEEDEYYQRLETLLLKLASLYEGEEGAGEKRRIQQKSEVPKGRPERAPGPQPNGL